MTVNRTFVSLGRHAYEVQVIETYNITTCNDLGQLEFAPSLESSAILLTSYEHCDPISPDLFVNSTVLVAGIHKTKSDGVYFLLTCDMGKPLVSIWKKKYNKNIVNWVKKGNPTQCT